ncbi:hypothetical protein QJS10_CPB17g00788 [Acorus calamus]|uniref:Reverse transcriptase zinc-binding domain-containing protein n=1 Tax=Acorus calamus TaxID=4465 RepID=A0AAV9CY66_ACOCL|nr:hypothetical protein QJS10_CPB17g00788 [Acorus calamus]
MSTMCEFCNQCPEMVKHLFCQCLALLPLWSLVEAATGVPTSFTNEEEMWHRMRHCTNPGSSRVQSRVVKIILPATLWAVWLNRNKKIFLGHRFYIENIWEDTVQLVTAWGCTLARARSVQLLGGAFTIDPG